MSEGRWNAVESYKEDIIDGNTIVSIWSIQDVEYQAKDDGVLLSLEEQRRVLRLVYDHHDTSVGINWENISYWINEVYEENG